MGDSVNREEIGYTIEQYEKLIDRAEAVAEALGYNSWIGGDDPIEWPAAPFGDDDTFRIQWEEYSCGDYDTRTAEIPMKLLWDESGDAIIAEKQRQREIALAKAKQKRIESAEQTLRDAKQRAKTAQSIADKAVERAEARLKDARNS